MEQDVLKPSPHLLKVLIIDNYDSFTYNLYQYVGEILDSSEGNGEVEVFRNNEITVEDIVKRGYNRIIISPGPGNPVDESYFGVCSSVILELGKTIPILGVCLGMQGIAHCFGGSIIKAKVPMHGKISTIEHDSKGVFQGLPEGLEVMRYHSLVADPATLPACLEVSSYVRTESETNKEIMGLRHKELPMEGIQFHPESFGTEGGKKMLENFILHNDFFSKGSN